MNKYLKFGLVAVMMAIICAGFYFTVARNNSFEAEELEIKTVLDSIYRAEISYFEDNLVFNSEYEILDAPFDTNRPTLVGVFPDCQESG